MLVLIKNLRDRGRLGPVCKECTTIDQGQMGQVSTEDEDVRLRTNVEGNDGSKPGMEGSKPGLKL